MLQSPCNRLQLLHTPQYGAEEELLERTKSPALFGKNSVTSGTRQQCLRITGCTCRVTSSSSFRACASGEFSCYSVWLSASRPVARQGSGELHAGHSPGTTMFSLSGCLARQRGRAWWSSTTSKQRE